jgi:hypothetical protein
MSFQVPVSATVGRKVGSVTDVNFKDEKTVMTTAFVRYLFSARIFLIVPFKEAREGPDCATSTWVLLERNWPPLTNFRFPRN